MKRIAVITPYNNEDIDLIKKANDSIFDQLGDNFSCEHIIIVDGIDEKNNLSDLRCHRIELKKKYNDNGNTPRSIGTNYAINRNFDFIMYLDADNWFLNNHVHSLLNLIKKDTSIACSYRSFYTVDEKKMSYLEDDDCLNKKFVDTSCYLIPRNFFKLINIWHLIPKETSQWCDRIFFYNILKNKCPIKFSGMHTVAFRTLYEVHYLHSKLDIPNNVKKNEEINKKAVNFFLNLKNKESFVKTFGFWWTLDKK